MKIGVITTSRADFGIYLPLLNKIKESEHHLMLFAGGMHTASHFGNSHQLIEEAGFIIGEMVDGISTDDSPFGLCESMALTLAGFSAVWKKYADELDVVFVLGDRFEMYAAASSIIPYNIIIAHLHGGETTLGAIDNKFRNAISMLSDYHFVSHEKHAEKLVQMTGDSARIFNVGALGVENLLGQSLMSTDAFFEKFKFDISKDYILTTIHPETVSAGKNVHFIDEYIAAVKEIDIPVLCTLPNADTEGSVLRAALLDFEKQFPQKLKCFENLGIVGYFTAMKNCLIMLGNTSSGIIEAASYQKWVIDLGDRQKGRFAPSNVVHVPFDRKEIVRNVQSLRTTDVNVSQNPYGKGNTAEQILGILETVFI